MFFIGDLVLLLVRDVDVQCSVVDMMWFSDLYTLLEINDLLNMSRKQ